MSEAAVETATEDKAAGATSTDDILSSGDVKEKVETEEAKGPEPKVGEKVEPEKKEEEKAEPVNKEEPAKEVSKETKAPETYKLELPKNSPLDESVLERIASKAKEQGLSNENAQKLVAAENEAVSHYLEKEQDGLTVKSEQWITEIENDKEIGGDHFKDSITVAKSVISKFASDEMIEILNKTGLGNHPELVRCFVRIGKTMAPDKLVLNNAEVVREKTNEEIFYPEKSKE